VTKLRLLVAAGVIAALALTATVDASASTTGSAHHSAAATVHAKKKKKKNKKKTPATVKLAAITAGTVLVSPDGRTLYMLDKENGTTTSACTGACATIWQADGRNQVAYNGHLLYNFSGDTAPGDAKGLGIPGWHAVSPEGAPVGGA
jgi:predicted lipoprotein with Yx(FWY)xxD motif